MSITTYAKEVRIALYCLIVTMLGIPALVIGLLLDTRGVAGADVAMQLAGATLVILGVNMIGFGAYNTFRAWQFAREVKGWEAEDAARNAEAIAEFDRITENRFRGDKS